MEPASKRKFLLQWQEKFTTKGYDDNKRICKICCGFQHVAGKMELVLGYCTFKKETLQKHNIGRGLLCAHDASLAKQKPMKKSPIAQGFRRGGMVLN